MRRICLTGAAVAGSLVLGAGLAAAKPGQHHAAAHSSASCRLALSVAVPSGNSQLALPAQSGDMYGPAHCPKIGSGVADFTFVLQGSGDLAGSFRQYYAAGTEKGKFALSPQGSGPTGVTTFSQQSYTGTVHITGGTAAYDGVAGTGTMSCSTNDSVHFACTEKLKLKLPSTAVA